MISQNNINMATTKQEKNYLILTFYISGMYYRDFLNIVWNLIVPLNVPKFVSLLRRNKHDIKIVQTLYAIKLMSKLDLPTNNYFEFTNSE